MSLVDNAKEATEHLQKILGPYYAYSDEPVFLALWRSYNDCQFVEDEGTFVPRRINHSNTLTASRASPILQRQKRPSHSTCCILIELSHATTLICPFSISVTLISVQIHTGHRISTYVFMLYVSTKRFEPRASDPSRLTVEFVSHTFSALFVGYKSVSCGREGFSPNHHLAQPLVSERRSVEAVMLAVARVG